MKDLSIGAVLAWQIAATETALSKHQYIEDEQILIGICSFEKIFMSSTIQFKIPRSDLTVLKVEYDSINKIFQNFNIEPTNLRRKIRINYGLGNFDHIEKIIHRSEECKATFLRADKMVENSEKISSLHLLGAIVENNNGVIKNILTGYCVNIKQLKQKILTYIKLFKNPREQDSYYI